MELREAILQRHAVRSYLDRPIEKDLQDKLNSLIDECNRECDLHIQLVADEPKAFDSFMAHYGKFSGVRNYIALVGKKCENLDEKLGYCGEKIALLAQILGLNTCWVAMTFKKIKDTFVVDKDEKLRCVIAIGYGATQGAKHKIKAFEEVSNAQNAPQWFVDGVNCALLAPTAMNQQKFVFELKDGNIVLAKAKSGFYSKVDLGIAKYHFEIGAGIENFKWQK